MEGLFTLFKRLGLIWDSIEKYIGGLFLTASVLIMFTEIVGRTFFNHSIVGAEEMASFCLIWSAFFNVSLAVKRNIHIRIDILPQVLSVGYARVLEALGLIAVSLFALYMTYSGVALIRESYLLGEVSMTSLRIPYWIPHIIMPIGGALLFFRLMQRLSFICSPRYLETLKGTEVEVQSGY